MAAAQKHFHFEICASSGNFPIVRLTSSEMTKSECRMTKEIRSTNDEMVGWGRHLLASDFVIVSSFVIRHSSFLS